MKRFVIWALFPFLFACPGDFDLEMKTFPCRGDADCVEDFTCHPTRFICVARNTQGLEADLGEEVEELSDDADQR